MSISDEISSLTAAFVQNLVSAFQRHNAQLVKSFVNQPLLTKNNKAAVSDATKPAGRVKRTPAKVSSRAGRLCYVPGCKNIAAPRFGMFCAKVHRNLPKRQKNKFREQHDAAVKKSNK